jgi:hypothetical protein
MGRGFTYSARLAVESIAQADPGARIEVHLLGDRPDSLHFDLIEAMPEVHVLPIDLDALFVDHPSLLAVFHRIPDTALSARSNLLRYLLLWHRGGVYVDFDVIVRKPLADLAGGADFIGVERVWSHDQPRVEGRWRLLMLPGTLGWALTWCARRFDSRFLHGALRLGDRLRILDPFWSTFQPNNAVIGAAAGSPFLAEVLKGAHQVDPTVRYALGPSLVAEAARQHPRTIRALREQILYPVPPADSFRYFEDRHLELHDETALIHYVSSNHQALLASLEPGDQRIECRPEVFWRLAREVAAGRPVWAHDPPISSPSIDT